MSAAPRALPRTMTALLAELAAPNPAASVRDDRGREVDYRLIAERVGHLAGGFARLGVRPGDHAAIWMNNRIEWLETWYALAALGAVIVPLNTRFKGSEVRYVLEQSDARWLVHDRAGQVDAHAFESMISGGLPLAGVVSLDHPVGASWTPFEDLFAAPSLPSVERPGAVGMIQYTSGSTAFPKGAMLRTEGLIRNAWNIGEAWMVTERDRILCSNPLFHNGGSVFSYLVGVTHNCYVRLVDAWSVDRAWEIITSESITVFPAIDAMLRDLAASPKRGTTLRLVSTAAARGLYESIIERIGIDVSNVFGLTECSPNVCVGDLRDTQEVRLRYTGRPQPGLEVRILDPDTRTPLASGQDGVIAVRGWSVMAGYYNMPEETRRVIDAEGFLWTGDLGRLSDNGYLEFRGRLKQMIKSGGENVSIEEVENELRAHPDIADALVVPVPHSRFGEVGYAYVRPMPGSSLRLEEVAAHARARLAGFKVPKHFELAEDFPRTGSGKVDRQRMSNLAAERVGGGS